METEKGTDRRQTEDLERQIGHWKNDDGGSVLPDRSLLVGQIDLAEYRKREPIQDPRLLAEWKEVVERDDNQPMGG